MDVTNVGFYFAMMALFLAEAAVVGRVWPLERRLLAEDLTGGRLLALDGLRGILAPSVFLHHAVLYFYFARNGNWFELSSNFYAQMGTLPVTLFFFITGYLFWAKMVRRPSLNFLLFIKERLRRLGPAYWFACLVLCGFVMVLSGFDREVSWNRLTLESLGWLSFLGAGHDVNHLYDSKRLLGQVWTLRLEWMFYLSLPFLGWFARRRMGLILLLTGAFVLDIFIAHVTLNFSGVANFLWKMVGDYTHMLVVIFSGGMVVAAIPVTERIKDWAKSTFATVISGLLLLLTIWKVPPQHGLLETTMLVIPFACVCFGNTWFGFLVSKPMRSLGRISYSFYLLHVFVLQAGVIILSNFVSIGSLNAWTYWSFISVCGICTVFFSYLSYQFLEHSFLRKSKVTSTILIPKTGKITIYVSPLRG